MKFKRKLSIATVSFCTQLFFNSAHSQQPLMTASPAPSPVSLECPLGAICVANCDQLQPEGASSEDVTACRHYFNSVTFFKGATPHEHVVRIPSSLNDLHISGDSTTALPILTQEKTLFIFDSDTTSGNGIVEYDLPKNYMLPSNSSLIGNKRSGKVPEITIPQNTSSAFVIKTNDPNADYLLADIEIDSREIFQNRTHQGVLDLKAARSVVLNNTKVVRKQVSDLFGGGFPSTISAIEIGCTSNMQPTYAILNSEIDVIDQDSGFQYGGPAFSVEGCAPPGHYVNFNMQHSLVKISEPGDLGILTDTVFLFDADTPISPKLHFQTSFCNAVEVNGDLTHYSEVLATDLTGETTRTFLGLFGLNDGNAWGMQLNPDSTDSTDSTYDAIAQSWEEWGENAPDCSRPTTSSMAYSSSVVVLTSSVPTPYSTISSTNPMMTPFIHPSNTPGVNSDTAVSSSQVSSTYYSEYWAPPVVGTWLVATLVTRLGMLAPPDRVAVAFQVTNWLLTFGATTILDYWRSWGVFHNSGYGTYEYHEENTGTYECSTPQ